MTSPGSGRGLKILELAQLIQTTIISHYDLAGFPLPARRWFTGGDPSLVAWDCDQFVIGLSGIGWGWAEDTSSQPSPQTSAHFGIAALRHAVFNIQIVRCAPSTSTKRDGFPDVDAMNDAGKDAFRDAGLLSQALVMSVKAINELITNGAGKAQAGVIAPLGPEGNYQAIAGTLSVTAGNLE